MAYVSIWTVFTILTEYLHMSNVHAPRMLNDIEKERRVRDSKSFFFKHYENESIMVPIEHNRLQQKNSPPHTAASILLELDVLGFERVDHLAYSPYQASFYVDVYPNKSQVKGPPCYN